MTFSEFFKERQATRSIIEKAAHGDGGEDLQRFVSEAQEGRIELPLVKSALKTIDAALKDAGEEPTRTTKKKGSTMPTSGATTTFANKAEVLREVNRLAEELRAKDPKLTMTAARNQVWKARPDLAQQYKELPEPSTPKKAGAVHKGQSTVDKVNEKAQELRKADPTLSPSAARSRVWETHPDLAQEYARASRS